MRVFEVVLILLNLLSLFLGLKKYSERVWLSAAGITLAVCFVHGVFEGFRYQMAFSYMFVAVLAVLSLVRISRKSEPTIPKLRKGMAISFSFVLLLLTAFLACALPVFTLPKPTGSYEVGMQYFHLVDRSRTDTFLDKERKPRELMIKVYYPATSDDSKPFSFYFHNSPAMAQSFAAFYGMPGFLFDHLLLVRTHSKENLQPSDQQPGYPVVLFSHGAGTTMEVQTSQSEDLASHGYIVVAIDHTYVSAATVFPGRMVSAKEATTDFHTTEPAEIITQIMADDASFVIDTLEEMKAGKIESIFAGKLDLEHIGAIGHSVGGAAAYNLAINDSRVKAAINLDGRMFVTPKNPETMAPFLMLASDRFQTTLRDRKSLMKRFEDMTKEEQQNMLFMYGSSEAYQEAYTRDTQNTMGLIEVLESSGNLFTIEGSDHMKFSDVGRFIGVRPLRELIGIGGVTDPARCLEITQAVTVAFFDQQLKGQTDDSLESLAIEYPELKRVDLK